MLAVPPGSGFSLHYLIDTLLCGQWLPRLGAKASRNDNLIKQESEGEYREWNDRVQFERQVMSTRTGISFLIGTVRKEGRSILKSEHVAGIVPDIRTSFP